MYLQTCGHSPVCDGHISTGVTIHHWPGSPAHNESWFVWLPAPHPQLSAAGWRDSRLGAAWENVTWLTRAAPSYLCPDASWLSLSDIHESSWFLLSLPSWNSNDTPKHFMFMVIPRAAEGLDLQFTFMVLWSTIRLQQFTVSNLSLQFHCHCILNCGRYCSHKLAT